MGRTTKLEDKYKASRTNLHSMEDGTEDRTTFFYYAFRNILLVSIPLLLVSGVVLFNLSIHSSAYSSSTDSVSLTLPSACTISASIISAHNATLVNGQYEGDIGNTKVNAYCNDNNGYNIYAIGSSNDSDGNTDLVSDINSNYNIHTGVYNAGTLTPSTPSSWAMKLSSSSGTYAPTIIDGYKSYSEVPSTDTMVAYRTSGTSMDPNTDITGSYFNTTYEIYANTLQPAGTYLGKVKYTMTHPYTSSDLPTIENAFDIAGKDKITVTDPITGETGDYYKMQDMSDRICNLTRTYGELSATQLVDIRDSKLYWVAKLADGHCWMTQNLDLGIGGTDVTALTSENTDISTDSTISGVGIYTDGYSLNNGVYTWSPENPTTNSGWTNSTTKEYSYDPGDTYPDDLATQQTAGSHGLSGNFYNWTAAVASNNSAGASSDNAANSICPKNWRLPNYDDKELDNLFIIYNVITAIGSNTYSNGGFGKLVDAPLYFIRAGGIGVGGSPAFNVGGVGYSWYSTSNTNTAYTLRFTENEIKTDYLDTKADGLTTRCLAR